jgi:hypothetical protein
MNPYSRQVSAGTTFSSFNIIMYNVITKNILFKRVNHLISLPFGVNYLISLPFGVNYLID